MVPAVRNPVSAGGQHIDNKNPVRKEPQTVWGSRGPEVPGWEGDLQSFSKFMRKIVTVMVSPTWCNHQHDMDLKWSCRLWVLIFAAWVCGRPVSPTVARFYPGSPGDPRQVQASPSQWAASSNRHVLRLILAFLPFWVLPSQGTEQWLLCFQCGTMWGASNEWWFLPGSSKISLPLMEVGPGEEMLGHWRSGEARLGLWGPASKWITCSTDWLVPMKLSRDWNIWIRTCGVERGHSSQWPKYLHLLSRPAFYFQLKETYMPRVFKYQRRVCCEWPGQRWKDVWVPVAHL